MKIAPLLAQYLYNNHQLGLPGIGTFKLDPSSINTPENSKQRSTVLEGISFESNSSLQDAADLVAFISSQTGKMKALANADLGSHLQLAQQFMNMGKPFYFEGIGTLVMKKQGEFDFEPASASFEKLKDSKTKEIAPVSLEESSAEYESFLDKPKTKTGWKKPVIALLVMAGVGLAIWGGYTISQRAPGTTVQSSQIQSQEIEKPPIDSIALSTPSVPDTVYQNYKYILERGSRQRTLKRYNQLKTNLWDVHMETKDSVEYKLYMLLPALNADTTHVVDSLTMWLGRKVYIELQN